MSFESVIGRLQEGPAILFLGQRYLSLELGTDFILQKIAAKYGNGKAMDTSSYKMLVHQGLAGNSPEIFQWLQGLCKSISNPFWLEEIAKYPWSGVYTSAYDTILERAFTTESRSVQPVVNQRYIINDPRNKNKLHITYLLGYIATAEEADRPPLRAFELSKRNAVMRELLTRIPNLVTPRGILVIDGYDIDDQVTTEDLYVYASQLGQHQTLICSASEELLADEWVMELIKTEKVIVSNDSFAVLLGKWEADGKVTFKHRTDNDYYGKWLTLPHERIKIPEELISKMAKIGFIPDDTTFYADENRSSTDRYTDFRRFLSSSEVLPNWDGYTQGFAFKRDYYEKLKTQVVNSYTHRERTDKPIFLYGQTSSGKTVSLGLLAYELRVQYNYPVLFIPKRYQRSDDMSIDSFCRWAEDNKAKYTVIIWDGMLDPEPYYKLLRFLNSRGRNVILVCSCYVTELDVAKARPSNYIDAPIELTTAEKSRFVDYLRSVDNLLANVIQSVEEPNLLALLYRYLPADRGQLRSGVHDEYNFFVKLLSNLKISENRPKGELFELFVKAGIISTIEEGEYLSKPLPMATETVSMADFLIFSVMVPGQYGLNVPFELLLDAIGYETFSSHIFKAMKQVDLIKWYDDEIGNIELGARTTLEAAILAKYAGGKRAEISYILMLLERIKTSPGEEFGSFDRQIEFAVQLLNEIGPNSTFSYIHSFYEVADTLRILRESRVAYHPRLVLKEALFLRGIVKKRRELPEVIETDLELLKRAEKMVRQALDDMGMDSERMIAAYLRGELATISGFLVQHYLNDPETAKDYYWQVRRLNNYSFATNPGNYLALDIAAWVTEKMLEAKIFTEDEKIEAETDLLNLFEMVETEGVSDEHLEEFQLRKIKFYEMVGKTPLADEVFEAMREKGFTYGIYLRARKKLGLDPNSLLQGERLVQKNNEAYKYLMKFFDEIKGDGRCLFLLLKTWWISRSKQSFFLEEKQAVPFNDSDWDFCLQITGLLLDSGEKFHSATVYYLRALAQFHLNAFKPAMDTFGELQEESNFSYGRKRVVKFYMFSTPDGKTRAFSGEVVENVSRFRHDKRGEIYVSELDLYIPFSLFEFGRNAYQKGDKIPAFYIAFNFLGPIAVPVKN